jgi:hypothetical protein
MHQGTSMPALHDAMHAWVVLLSFRLPTLPTPLFGVQCVHLRIHVSTRSTDHIIEGNEVRT